MSIKNVAGRRSRTPYIHIYFPPTSTRIPFNGFDASPTRREVRRIRFFPLKINSGVRVVKRQLYWHERHNRLL